MRSSCPTRWLSSGQGSPGHQSPGRAIIAMEKLVFNSVRKASRGKRPASVTYCHCQGCVTNHPKTTALELAHESGLAGARPLAAGWPRTSAVGEVNTIVLGPMFPQGGRHVGGSGRGRVMSPEV